jgi:hypothetical protein
MLKEHDVEENFEGPWLAQPEDLAALFNEYFASREQPMAVLGIDIYQYSKFPRHTQRLVPVIFKYLYDETVTMLRRGEAFFFGGDDFEKGFIPTGDGGFQMFETPLSAIVFALYFQLVLSGYNASFYFPKLRRLVGPLTLRYGLTYDHVVRIDHNWFGPAIIKNARITARDTLNRLLVDGETIQWFADRIGTVETMATLTAEDIKRIKELAWRDRNLLQHSVLFRSPDATAEWQQPIFRSVVSQKIGRVTSKNDQYDVYNLFVQVLFYWVDLLQRVAAQHMVVALGNLHTEGIAE